MIYGSVNAFLHRLIDYAGMFPPANLNLNDAFGEYTEYIQCPDEWMLNRFILPVSKIKDLTDTDEYIKAVPQDFKIKFSLLLSGGNTAAEFTKNLKSDFPLADTLNEKSGGLMIADNFEVKIPAEVMQAADFRPAEKFIREISRLVNEHSGEQAKIFFESFNSADFEKVYEYAAGAIAESNSVYNNAGFKLRTGGVTEDAFPSIGQVSYAVYINNKNKVPFKATAGLHHPVRHFNSTVKTKMHGFLNIFGAGILAHINSLSPAEITEIISEENPDSFRFTENGFKFRSLNAGTEEIEKARNEFAVSYGSCSFDEPREDLRNLKLL